MPMRSLSLSLSLAAALLAGCEAMPVGTVDNPQFVADAAQAQHDLYFAPGSPSLAPGQAGTLAAFLRGLVLNPQDDVILNVGRAETPVLNAQRLATLRQTMASIGTPARVRFVQPPGFVDSDSRPDVVFVQVQRYGRIRVVCPSNQVPGEITTPMPTYLSCTNGINLANMAAEPRDLIAPRDFGGTDAVLSTNAVGRLWNDKVKGFPQPIDTSN
jgi:type IV pilus biogenesis protein CpaD/CtpE